MHEPQKRQYGRIALVAALLLAILCAAGVLWLARSENGDTEPELADPTTAVQPAPSAGQTASESSADRGGAPEAMTTTRPRPAADSTSVATATPLRGVVLDRDGAPISGATVSWATLPDNMAVTDSALGDYLSAASSGNPLATISDASGKFALALPEGTTDGGLYATHADYVSVAVRVSKEALQTTHELRLDLAATISGRVIDQGTGHGVPDIMVHVSEQLGSGFAGLIGTPPISTDATGGYVHSGLKAGQYTIRIATGDTSYTVTEVSMQAATVGVGEERAGVDFEVKPGATISGTILLPDGTNAAGAEVRAYPADIMARQMSGDTSVWFQDKSATADEQGWFTIRGLAVEKHMIVAKHDDATPSTLDNIELTDEQMEVTVELQLQRGSRVFGVVTDEAGDPVPGAVVRLMPDLAAVISGQMHVADSEGKEECDEDGRYEFTVRPAGRYRVYLPTPGTPDNNWSAAWGGAEGKEVTLDGESDFEVNLASGEVTDAGSVVVTGRVQDDQGQPIEGARIAGSDNDTRSDLQGNFTLTVAATDSILLTATAGSYDKATVRVVPASPRAVMTLNRMATISGRVVLPDGESPGVAFGVSAQGVGQGLLARFQRMTTGESGDKGLADGTFKLENVKAGEIEVVATVPGFPEASSGLLDVTPGAELTGVVIELAAGGSLTGLVLLPDGAPAPGATVFAVPADAGDGEKMQYYYMGAMMGYHGQTTADGSGRYTLAQLGPGRYEVRATHHVMAPSPAEEVRLAPGGAQELPTLYLSTGGKIEGVVTRNGKPQAGVMVQANGGTGGMKQVATKPDGSFLFEGLGEGDYAVHFTDMSGMLSGKGMGMKFRAVTIAPEQVVKVEIDLGGGHTLSGKIDGVVGAMTMIQVRREGGPLPEELDMMNMSHQVEASRYMAGMAMVQRDGEYSITGLEPGEYFLEVPWMPEDPMDFGAYQTEDRTPRYRARIRVQKQDLTHDIRIRMP